MKDSVQPRETKMPCNIATASRVIESPKRTVQKWCDNLSIIMSSPSDRATDEFNFWVLQGRPHALDYY